MKLTKLLDKIVYTNKLNLIVGIIVFPNILQAQNSHSYSLTELQGSAFYKYPYAKQLKLSSAYRIESIKSSNAIWLPQVIASAKNTYQSEITAINLPPDLGITLKGGKKHQYQSEIAISQLIYDGGVNEATKTINKLTADIQTDQILSSMLQLESNVNNLFEAILIKKEEIKAFNFQKEDLESRRKDLALAAENGLSLKAKLQELDAEIILLEQKIVEAKMQQYDLCSQLSFFTQEKIETSTILELPVMNPDINNDFSNRPDYLVFDKQLKSTEWQLKEINRAAIPQFSFFANGFYGRPGINTLDFSTHYSGIAGLSLKWNIGMLYSTTHQKRLLRINHEMIQNQQSVFEIEMNKQISQINTEILKINMLIEKDDNIVQIRSNIKDIAAIQLKNGSITLTDYLIKLNAESQAMINKSIHKIELQMNYAKKKTLLNQNN